MNKIILKSANKYKTDSKIKCDLPKDYMNEVNSTLGDSSWEGWITETLFTSGQRRYTLTL